MLAARSPERLAALAADVRLPRPHEYDSHPPIAERVALLLQLPADADADAGPDAGPAAGAASAPADAPAITLLREADAVFAALEPGTLTAQGARLPRTTWDAMVRAHVVAEAEAFSQPLRLAVARATGASRDRLPDLEEVLAAFDAGLLWTDIAGRLPKPPQAARLTGASARNFIRPAVFDALAGLIHLHLLASGDATPTIAWPTRPGLTLPPHWESTMDAALDAATSDTPDTTPLRTLLATTTPAPA
jgi:hypothetical protein